LVEWFIPWPFEYYRRRTRLIASRGSLGWLEECDWSVTWRPCDATANSRSRCSLPLNGGAKPGLWCGVVASALDPTVGCAAWSVVRIWLGGVWDVDHGGNTCARSIDTDALTFSVASWRSARHGRAGVPSLLSLSLPLSVARCPTENDVVPVVRNRRRKKPCGESPTATTMSTKQSKKTAAAAAAAAASSASVASSSSTSIQSPPPSTSTPIGRRPGSPLSPTRYSRLQEKQDLQNLNDRLACYIEKVRLLESENSRLNREVQTTQETVTREVSNIKSMYEHELSDARKLLDETAKERAKLEIDTKRLWDDNEDLKSKWVCSNIYIAFYTSSWILITLRICSCLSLTCKIDRKVRWH